MHSSAFLRGEAELPISIFPSCVYGSNALVRENIYGNKKRICTLEQYGTRRAQNGTLKGLILFQLILIWTLTVLQHLSQDQQNGDKVGHQHDKVTMTAPQQRLLRKRDDDAKQTLSKNA